MKQTAAQNHRIEMDRAAWRYRMGALFLLAIMLLAACGDAAPQPQPTADAVEPVPTGAVTGTPPPQRTPAFTPTPSPSPTRAITVEAASLRGQVVTFWHPYSAESQVLLDLITQEFNQTNPWGIRVESTLIPGFNTLEETLRQAIQAQVDELPDILPMHTYQAVLLDANGETFLDLQPYVNDAEYGLTAAEQADFIPAIWQQEHVPPQALKGTFAPEGKHIGLSWVRSGLVLLYNQSWARELGFPVAPQSATGFRDQACAAAQANLSDGTRANDGSGGWLVTGNPSELLGWLYAYGSQITRLDGRGYQFDTPEARQAVEFIQELARKGCIWQPTGVDAANPESAIAARQALFTLVSLADLPRIQVALVEAEVDWLVLPFPSPGGTAEARTALVTYGPSLIIARSNPERQLAAWLFARWLVSAENQARWAQFNYLLPTRQSAVDHLRSAASQSRAWRETLQYLPDMQPEPYLGSWGVLRWSLGDALKNLVRAGLTVEEAIRVLQLLDELATEVQLQVR